MALMFCSECLTPSVSKKPLFAVMVSVSSLLFVLGAAVFPANGNNKLSC